VIDYGVIENHGMASSTPTEAVEVSLVSRLEQWRSEQLSGHVDMVLIDSGTFTRAVYDFIKRVGYPFYAAKGQSSKIVFDGKDTTTRRHFEQVRADYQPQEKVWLYNVNVDYWKLQVQQRFKTATFSESHEYNDGSLSLFSTDDRKEHLSFSQHIVAEELQERFRPGKGVRTEWVVKNKNNHWLDAMTYALAATGILGFKMMRQPVPLASHQPRPRPASQPANFRSRPGGWIKGMKDRGR
jgi:phage terminase large subunit GpA-like protein